MIAAIEAERCNLPVPDRWLSFPGKKQDENDNGGAVLCLAAAAVYLDLVYEDITAAALLSSVRPRVLRRSISRRQHTTGMLLPQDLAALAVAGRMSLHAPTHPSVQQFLQQGQLWIVLVRQRFINPIAKSCAFKDKASRQGPARRSVVRNHYLLVLDYLRGHDALVVFDPHPWNRLVYCVRLEMFERAWRAARRMQFPWSAALLPASQHGHAMGY
jgi:hypothetical protein